MYFMACLCISRQRWYLSIEADGNESSQIVKKSGYLYFAAAFFLLCPPPKTSPPLILIGNFEQFVEGFSPVNNKELVHTKHNLKFSRVNFLWEIYLLLFYQSPLYSVYKFIALP